MSKLMAEVRGLLNEFLGGELIATASFQPGDKKPTGKLIAANRKYWKQWEKELTNSLPRAKSWQEGDTLEVKHWWYQAPYHNESGFLFQSDNKRLADEIARVFAEKAYASARKRTIYSLPIRYRGPAKFLGEPNSFAVELESSSIGD